MFSIMRLNRICIFIVLSFLIAGPLCAQGSAPEDTAELDKRAFSIYQQVMSPFCPGRALSDCPSSKAHDLKAEIRARLEAGEDPGVVLEGVFSKYGDQYRAVPGYSGFAALAWLAPAVFLIVGLIIAVRLASRGQNANAKLDGKVESAELPDDLRLEIERELSKLD